MITGQLTHPLQSPAPLSAFVLACGATAQRGPPSSQFPWLSASGMLIKMSSPVPAFFHRLNQRFQSLRLLTLQDHTSVPLSSGPDFCSVQDVASRCIPQRNKKVVQRLSREMGVPSCTLSVCHTPQAQALQCRVLPAFFSGPGALKKRNLESTLITGSCAEEKSSIPSCGCDRPCPHTHVEHHHLYGR